MTAADRRWSSSSSRSEISKFPDFEPSPASRQNSTIYEERAGWRSPENESADPAWSWTKANGASLHSERRAVRKDNSYRWANGHANGTARGHGRQKSLSDAIKTIRSRKGSVSANAQEIAEALKAPVSIKLVVRYPSPMRSSDDLANYGARCFA